MMTSKQRCLRLGKKVCIALKYTKEEEDTTYKLWEEEMATEIQALEGDRQLLQVKFGYWAVTGGDRGGDFALGNKVELWSSHKVDS